MLKIAEQADFIGRIMYRGFMDELEKDAVGTQIVDTPDPGMIPAAPQIQLPRHPVGTDKTSRVQAILNKLKASTEVGASEIAQVGDVVDRPGRSPLDEGVAIGAVKTSGDKILEILYNKFFK